MNGPDASIFVNTSCDIALLLTVGRLAGSPGWGRRARTLLRL